MALKYIEKYEQVLSNKKLNPLPPKLKETQTVKFLDWYK
jgi:hypothetical protein